MRALPETQSFTFEDNPTMGLKGTFSSDIE
jgi:hypothetical protein